jgi:hypothetical protein
MSFFPDITPLTKEINEFKTNQRQQLDLVIALLQEQNKLLQQLLPK